MSSRLETKYTKIKNCVLIPKYKHEAENSVRLTNRQVYDMFVANESSLSTIIPNIGSLCGHMVQAKQAIMGVVPNSRRTECNEYAGNLIVVWRRIFNLPSLGKLDPFTKKSNRDEPTKKTKKPKSIESEVSVFLDLNFTHPTSFESVDIEYELLCDDLFRGSGKTHRVKNTPLFIIEGDRTTGMNAICVHKRDYTNDVAFDRTFKEMKLNIATTHDEKDNKLANARKYDGYLYILEMYFLVNLEETKQKLEEFYNIYTKHINNIQLSIPYDISERKYANEN